MNRVDEPGFMAVPKLLPTKFDTHHELESCPYKTNLKAHPATNISYMSPICHIHESPDLSKRQTMAVWTLQNCRLICNGPVSDISQVTRVT